MQLSIILNFIKSFWRECLIVILITTIAFMHINNNILEAELSVSKQQTQNEINKLEISNASVVELQNKLNEQNNKLQEISDKAKERQESLKGQIAEAKQKAMVANKNLEEYINSQEGLSGNECQDMLSELQRIGE